MEAVKRFFSSPRFAVAGASNDSHKFGYKLLAWYHQHSLPVTPLNPRAPSIQLSSSHSYDTVASPRLLPSPSQTSLSVVTPPAVTLPLLQEAHSVGIPAVWLQPGTFDDAVLDFARSHFEAVIAGDGGRGSEGWCIPPTPSASSALYRSISIPQRKRGYPEPESRHVKVLHTPHRPPPMVNDFFADLDESYDHEDNNSSFHRPSRYREYPRTPLDASLTDSSKEPDGFRRKRCRVEDPSLVVAASPSGMDEKAAATEQTPTAAGPLRWSRAVLNVVGKVWDFCWSGPFRGFYAGGGRGYPLEPSEPEVAEVHQSPSASPFDSRPSSSSAFSPFAEKGSSSVPGEYPLDVGEEALNGNWVMVSPREGATGHDTPSARPRSRRCHVPRKSVVHRRTPSKRALAPHPQPTFSAPAKPHESPVSVETQRYLARQRKMEREEDASLRRLNRQLQAMIQEGKQALGTRVEVDMDMDMED
ncbi:CoA binding domain-containing protein [Aspergillus karnatakaensis]|uniref:CoA-binding protein n=1 Tax=Aspergillus karnatakaensis TaxID=1810916 RepID=UPI003CCE2ECE